MKRNVYLILGLVVLALIGLRVITTLGGDGVSDEEKIKKVLAQTKEAAERKDANAINQLISGQFSGDGIDSSQIKTFLTQNLKRVSNVQVTYSEPVINVTGDLASVKLAEVNVKFEFLGQSLSQQGKEVKLALKRETTTRYLVLKRSEWHYTSSNQIPGISNQPYF